MGKLFLLALSLTASTPLFAGEAPQRFTRDGVTYVYTTRENGDRTIIEGRSYPRGSGFYLVVKNGRVTGTSGGIPVAFAVTSAKGAGAVQTAAR